MTATEKKGPTAKLEARVESLELLVRELHSRLTNTIDGFETFKEMEFNPLSESFYLLRPKVEGRNKSSSEKRDMTDEDALKCLTGEFRQFNHKNAAAEMGLTYAQIYSCRLEYTFKHVHKRLRDEGWKNPWGRGG